VLLDGADTMNLQSANCLLKTIEEPPPHTVIILSTTLPYQIPATIRSRCQRIAFQPLSPHLIEEALQESLGAEKTPVCRLVANLASGSLGKALHWIEADVLTRRQRLLALIARPHPPDLTAILDYAEELGEDREALIELLDFVRLWLRDLMIAKETGVAHELMNIDLIDETLAAAARLNWSYLFDNAELISEVQSALKGAVNPRIALERMLLTAAAAPVHTTPPDSLNHRTAFTM
jgi:DNA polymerase-3 subunit delta'